MVDFQSRNTRSGSPSDDAAEGSASPGADATDEDATTGNDSTDDTGSETTGVAAALATVSDDRTAEDDPVADAVADALESAGHGVVVREVLRTSHDSVQQTVDTLVGREDVTAVVTTGGTGVSPRDVTVEAVHPLVDKELPGFGERFRSRYADAVGTDAVATRATAGIVEATPVFCLPGDEEAARIGTSELVVEQAERLARLASGDGAADP